MKKLLYILPLVAAVTLSSCGDDDDSGPSSGTPAGGMSAKVDGAAWSSAANSTFYDTFGGGISVDGTKMNGQTSGESISVSIPTATATGTFTGEQLDGTFITYDASGNMEIWSTPSDSTSNATVTITKLQDNKISGTFSFTATGTGTTTGTKTITDGVFSDVALEE